MFCVGAGNCVDLFDSSEMQLCSIIIIIDPRLALLQKQCPECTLVCTVMSKWHLQPQFISDSYIVVLSCLLHSTCKMAPFCVAQISGKLKETSAGT